MQDSRLSLFARDDTFFGVCQGIAEDFGFNPLWLRLLLTFAVFVQPVAAVSIYLALGVVVIAARWFVPPASTIDNPKAADAPVAGNDQAPEATALAA